MAVLASGLRFPEPVALGGVTSTHRLRSVERTLPGPLTAHPCFCRCAQVFGTKPDLLNIAPSNTVEIFVQCGFCVLSALVFSVMIGTGM